MKKNYVGNDCRKLEFKMGEKYNNVNYHLDAVLFRFKYQNVIVKYMTNQMRLRRKGCNLSCLSDCVSEQYISM